MSTAGNAETPHEVLDGVLGPLRLSICLRMNAVERAVCVPRMRVTSRHHLEEKVAPRSETMSEGRPCGL
jgi:hypothetical protein